MYGVLVCEDEDIIRRKIIRAIDWQANGFGPVLEARTGEDAVVLFERNEVQILVSDIRMPGMGGLKLIERVKRQRPQTKVVVISGYSEFEYARAAIRLDVHDYILKPFRSRKLLEVLLDLRGLIEEERARLQDLSDLRSQLVTSSGILRERLIADLIERPPDADLSVASTYLGSTSLERQPVFVAVVAIDRPSPARHLSARSEETGHDRGALRAVRLLAEERELPWQVVRYGGDRVALVIPGSPEEAEGELALLLARVSQRLSAGVTIGVGCAHPGLKNAWRSFHEACDAARLSFFRGSGRIYFYREVTARSTSLNEVVRVMHGRRIFEELRSGAFQEIEREIGEIFKGIEGSSLDASSVGAIVTSVVLTTSLALEEVGQDVTAIFGRAFDPLSRAREIGNLAQARDWLLQFFEAIRLDAQRRRGKRNRRLVDQIRSFVSSNFREEITLANLATRFNISPSYISLLFKTFLGRTFSDYLSDLRIRKAMELLTYSDLRVYEIAEAVGYRDPYYFSTSFKRLTGLSPREYRSKDR